MKLGHGFFCLAFLRDGTTGIAPIASATELGCPGQAFQQLQRGRELVRLAGDQDKIDQPAGGITDTHDLAAQSAA